MFTYPQKNISIYCINIYIFSPLNPNISLFYDIFHSYPQKAIFIILSYTQSTNKAPFNQVNQTEVLRKKLLKETNMTIEKYGVTLKRLTVDKIELVRNWRNDPKISQYMEFRDYITPEMQAKWFAKINNDQNYYFIIEYKGKEIGLTNVKDIDYGAKTGEGGIFIYDDSFLNSDIPFRVIFALNDFCFDELHLEKMIAHIMSDNKRAIDFNRVLGYKKDESSPESGKMVYILTKEDYLKQRNRFAKLLK